MRRRGAGEREREEIKRETGGVEGASRHTL
jgi:hypothetical protein